MFVIFDFPRRSEPKSSRDEARQYSRLCQEAKRSEVEVTRGETKRFRKNSPRFGLWLTCMLQKKDNLFGFADFMLRFPMFGFSKTLSIFALRNNFFRLPLSAWSSQNTAFRNQTYFGKSLILIENSITVAHLPALEGMKKLAGLYLTSNARRWGWVWKWRRVGRISSSFSLSSTSRQYQFDHICSKISNSLDHWRQLRLAMIYWIIHANQLLWIRTREVHRVAIKRANIWVKCANYYELRS